MSSASGETLWSVDWSKILIPEQSIAELIIRGSLMYLAIFLILRLVLRRQVGGMGPSDILVVILIAEAAQNGLALDYKSVTEGAILVSTILFWSFAIEWAQSRFPPIERLLREPKLKLIENGHMLHRNMRAESVTREELMSQLREEGLEDCAMVKVAYLEADGRVSVIRRDDRQQ